MKKYLILALIVLGALPARAQIFSGDDVINNPNFDKQRFSYGYFLGFNTYDFDFDYKNYIANPGTGKDFYVDKTIGFNVGLIGNMRLSDHLDLRLEPGVSFNRINFIFSKSDPVIHSGRSIPPMSISLYCSNSLPLVSTISSLL